MRIALDIDGVLADWVGAVIQQARELGLHDLFPRHPEQVRHYDDISHEDLVLLGDAFGDWSTFLMDHVDPLVHPDMLPFQPAAYVTHRSTRYADATEIWMHRHGFNSAPIIHVPKHECKSTILHDLQIDVFVDDSPGVFEDINGRTENRLTCYLLDQPWNRSTEAGSLRLFSLAQLDSLSNA